MFTRRTAMPGNPPPVPRTLAHQGYEMTGTRHTLRSLVDQERTITPYLGLRARLSQIWINRWTILLLLVLARTLLSIGSLNVEMADAKSKALSACTDVENVGSAMASMPHYLSVGVNSLAADGITKAISGMVDLLMMILTGVQQLILFVINMYIGTYACLIAALIHGALDVAVGVVEDTVQFFDNAIAPIVNTITSAVNDFLGEISKIPGLGSLDITGDLSSLQNINVSSTQFVQDLVSLNSTIPTFAQAENLTKEAIAIPFNYVMQALNESYGSYEFNASIFPVAQKKSLQFCSNNSELDDFFQLMFKILVDGKIVAIVLLLLLAVLACIPQAILEIRRWNTQKKRARILTKASFDGMDVVYISSRPFTAWVGLKLASRFSGKRQLLVRWAVAYATTLPALFVLSLAMAGLFSCLIQYFILIALKKEAPILAADVGDFAGEVVSALNNVSAEWANDANGVVLGLQNDINNDLLGWVVNATSAVNNTLNTFENEINTLLSDVFNGTILYNTVMDVVYCLVEKRIDTVEEGLTWVHNNAHVTLPLFANDTFSEGASSSIQGNSNLTSFLSTPSTGTADEITAAVDYVINGLQSSIIQEALISTALLMAYVIIVLVGVIRSLSGIAMPGEGEVEPNATYVSSSELHQEQHEEVVYTEKKVTSRFREGRGDSPDSGVLGSSIRR